MAGETGLCTSYIDSHCHLDLSAFDEDRGQVIARSVSAGVGLMVVPATTPESWQEVLSLADQYPVVRIALGLHPYFLGPVSESALSALKALIEKQRSRIVALGETGLDRLIDVDFDKQQFFFKQQLKIAEEFGLPVIIHSRKANDDVAGLVRYSEIRKGVVHAFSGSYQQALAFWKIGLRIGVGGVITYERAQKTRKAVAQMPVDSLVLETDAPDMPLSGRQGERNTPECVPEVFSSLSQIRPEDPDMLRLQILRNTRALFSLDEC